MNGVAVLDEKLDAMPKFKKRPIGRTGHRFILEHSFTTSSGGTYSGFALQYPKVFGFRPEKNKEVALLVANRNAKSRAREECERFDWSRAGKMWPYFPGEGCERFDWPRSHIRGPAS